MSFYALVFFYIYKPTHPVHLGQWDIYYDTSRDLTKALLLKKCLQDHQKNKNRVPRFIIYCVLSKGHFLRVDSLLYTPLRKTRKRNLSFIANPLGKTCRFLLAKNLTVVGRKIWWRAMELEGFSLANVSCKTGFKHDLILKQTNRYWQWSFCTEGVFSSRRIQKNFHEFYKAEDFFGLKSIQVCRTQT